MFSSSYQVYDNAILVENNPRCYLNCFFFNLMGFSVLVYWISTLQEENPLVPPWSGMPLVQALEFCFLSCLNRGLWASASRNVLWYPRWTFRTTGLASLYFSLGWARKSFVNLNQWNLYSLVSPSCQVPLLSWWAEFRVCWLKSLLTMTLQITVCAHLFICFQWSSLWGALTLTLARRGSHHTQPLCCGPQFFSTRMGTQPCKEQKKEKHIQTSQVFMNARGLRSCSFSLSTTVSTGSSACDPELFLGSQGLMSGVRASSVWGVHCRLVSLHNASPLPHS